MMRSTPIKRKTPLHGTRDAKADREPWIKPKPRRDLSRMDCCPEAKRRAGLLVLMGCAACGKVPAQIHHLRDGHGLSERAPWWETIPLCSEHHNGMPFSTHGMFRREFHRMHGKEREILDRVNQKLPGLCGLGEDR